MAKKKAGSRPVRQKRKKKSKKTIGIDLKKSFLGVFILIVLVVAAGFVIHYWFAGKPAPRQAPVAHVPMAPVKKPAFEIYPEKEIPYRRPLPDTRPVSPATQPAVAIIIDDIGEDRGIADKFLSLNRVLTFSVLPQSTFQREIARRARSKGVETMLHLPMEPTEYPAVNPGSGALLTAMTPDQLIEQLNSHIDSVPFITGVNNHMGSKMTAESAQMYQIFSVLKKRNLFFIDSRTSSQTVCRPSARLFQLRFAQRDVFLDNVQKPDAVRRQIQKLVLIANSHGEAIGIGHPHKVTYDVLREVLPEIERKVRLVPASALVRPVG